MKRRTFVSSIVLLTVLPSLTACSSLQGFKTKLFKGGSGEGVTQVDDLLGRIERVELECELSRDAATEAYEALAAIVDPGFRGDPLAGYSEFVSALESSRERGETLRDNVEPMKETAEDFFAQWAEDLDTFTNNRMRQRSQTRLEETRARYDAILAAVEPAQWELDAFHSGLEDLSLFLGNDFNRSALASIEGEVRMLRKQAGQLGERLNAAMEAAENYVRSSAMPGQIGADGTDAGTR